MSPRDLVTITRTLRPNQAGSTRHTCERRELPQFLAQGWKVEGDHDPHDQAAPAGAPQASACGSSN